MGRDKLVLPPAHGAFTPQKKGAIIADRAMEAEENQFLVCCVPRLQNQLSSRDANRDYCSISRRFTRTAYLAGTTRDPKRSE
jgi:hypothetical protein